MVFFLNAKLVLGFQSARDDGVKTVMLPFGSSPLLAIVLKTKKGKASLGIPVHS